MKLTKETLKRIIKEEIDHLMLEEKAEQAAEKAEELLDSPKALKAMDRLEDDPKVAAALDQVIAQLQMNESYSMDDYQKHLDSKEQEVDGSVVAGGGFLGAMASPVVASMVLKSAAGKALIAAIGGGGAASLGVGALAAGGAVAIPMAIAMVLAKLDAKKEGK